MADDITNIVILEHIQKMKNDLQDHIAVLQQKIVGVEKKMGGFEKNMTSLTDEMRRSFEDARLHRQALQEDLEATMRMLSKHETKLARL